LRICLATGLFPPAVGGEERQAALLAEGLCRSGHRVTVVTQPFPGAPRREARDGLQVERAVRTIRRGPMFGPSYLASLGWFLLQHRGAFDVIQATYLYWDAVAAALLKPLLGSRLVLRTVVAGPGGDLDRFRAVRLWPLAARLDRPTLDRLVAVVVRRADACITLTARGQAELEALGVPRTRCHVVPNGIEVARFAAVTPAPSPGGARRLLCVARLAEQKGLDVLLRALPAVRAATGAVALTLLGDGPDRSRLQVLAADLGLAEVASFRGVVQDVRPFLAAAHAFVLPSRYEGIPLAILEAMAAGLPVVATAVEGNADLIRNGVDGLLVPRDDPAALAEALVRVLQDAELARRLGAEARRRAAAHYTVEAMVERTLRIYREVLAAPRAREAP
jgi:glycosyltransferase involved in cell wall biosynthesis